MTQTTILKILRINGRGNTLRECSVKQLFKHKQNTLPLLKIAEHNESLVAGILNLVKNS